MTCDGKFNQCELNPTNSDIFQMHFDSMPSDSMAIRARVIILMYEELYRLGLDCMQCSQACIYKGINRIFILLRQK